MQQIYKFIYNSRIKKEIIAVLFTFLYPAKEHCKGLVGCSVYEVSCSLSMLFA